MLISPARRARPEGSSNIPSPVHRRCVGLNTAARRKRKATKWRCPAGECQPGSMWRKASRLHPLIPRESKRFKQLYPAVRPSSVSSAGSNMSGRYFPSESVGSTGPAPRRSDDPHQARLSALRRSRFAPCRLTRCRSATSEPGSPAPATGFPAMPGASPNVFMTDPAWLLKPYMTL